MMLSNWLPSVLFSVVFAIIIALFRRMAPPRSRLAGHSYDEFQVPEPLPTGVIGAAMWSLGIGLCLLFFALRGANHLWASLEGPAILTQYATAVIWCFFPGFAALSIPWPLTVWYLRRIGRWEEADGIEDASDSKSGLDSFRIMKRLSFWLVCPIAFFTLLAIPIHLSITNSEVRVGHYASIREERFPLKEARRMTIVDGYKLRDGSFTAAKDVIIDFADGRRLRGNQVGDGGSSVRDDVLQLLIAKTGLTPQHALTADEIPTLREAK
jgi:hypothetical protein